MATGALEARIGNSRRESHQGGWADPKVSGLAHKQCLDEEGAIPFLCHLGLQTFMDPNGCGKDMHEQSTSYSGPQAD